MFVAYVAVTVVTIFANVFAVVADVRGAGFVLATSAEVGVSRSWLPLLDALKAAGAAGLLIGLLGNVRLLGISAAIGLTLFFTGALIAHLRARVFYNLHFPGAYWLLAIASTVLAVAR